MDTKDVRWLGRLEFNKPVKAKVTSGRVVFTDGTIIEDHHEQDCCETVAANWDDLKDTTIDIEEFVYLEIGVKKEYGLVLRQGYKQYGVACHNSQNGYYSDDLELRINTSSQSSFMTNITDGNQDFID